MAGRPYIAGELFISSLTFPYTFTIGSGSATGGFNNPPLASGTSYTFFIRAFPSATHSYNVSNYTIINIINIIIIIIEKS